jgi:excisionase family DNA binding protein
MQEFLTPEEVAIRLGVHPKNVRVWCRTGKLKCTRVGGRWKIAPEDLALFLKPIEKPTKKKEERAQEFLTPREVAIRLAVDPKTVRDWCRSGRLACTRIGGRWRIAPADLILFIKPTKGPQKS